MNTKSLNLHVYLHNKHVTITLTHSKYGNVRGISSYIHKRGYIWHPAHQSPSLWACFTHTHTHTHSSFCSRL